MKTFQSLLVIALLAIFTTGTNGFVANKKKNSDRRRAAFTSNNNNNNNEDTANNFATRPSPSDAIAASAFVLPPTDMTTSTALSAAYDYEEEQEQDDDVSYGVALVSCVLSLAVGFGTGYLV
mmetsp:Transcript_47295/g.52886  ORF Transcript_47295/g.52886 Transcript_47295/m.52886 type:complete len:122 (+) Transcript_47295:88-453(+)